MKVFRGSRFREDIDIPVTRGGRLLTVALAGISSGFAPDKNEDIVADKIKIMFRVFNKERGGGHLIALMSMWGID